MFDSLGIPLFLLLVIIIGAVPGNGQPTLVIRPQHTIWNSTGFIKTSSTDGRRQTLDFIAIGKYEPIGIPEELIITTPEYAIVVKLKTDSEVSPMALVVLRPTFVDSCMQWLSKFKVVILDDRQGVEEETRKTETGRIVAELNKKYLAEVGPEIIVATDLNSISEDFMVMSASGDATNSNLKNPILVDPFKYDRMLESNTECILQRITPSLLNLLPKSDTFDTMVKAINRMRWTSDLVVDRKFNAILAYTVINTTTSLKNTILNKFSANLTAEQTWYSCSVLWIRERNYASTEGSGIVHDVVILVTTTGSGSFTAQVEFSYVVFKNPEKQPYVIYVSDLLDECTADFPRNSTNIVGQNKPQLGSISASNVPNHLSTSSTEADYNPDRPNLVINLSHAYFYIYRVDTSKDLKTYVFVDDFTEKDIIGCPTLSRIYEERLINTKNFFSIRFEQRVVQSTQRSVWKEYFVILKDGAMQDILELREKYNLIHTIPVSQVMENRIIGAIEKNFGKIFCRRYSLADFKGLHSLPQEVLERDGFNVNKTVHIRMSPLGAGNYKYSFVVDPFDPTIPQIRSGMSNIKSILMEELHSALLKNENDGQITAIIQRLSKMRYKCMDDPLCINLIISMKVLLDANHDNTISPLSLLLLSPYYNIIPWSNNSMDKKLNELETEAEIFSTKMINYDDANSKTVFIAANVDEIQDKYRTQTILCRFENKDFGRHLNMFLLCHANRNIQSSHASSIEVFNLRLPTSRVVAEKLFKFLPTMKELKALPVLVLSDGKHSVKSLKDAIGLRKKEISSVKIVSGPMSAGRNAVIAVEFTIKGYLDLFRTCLSDRRVYLSLMGAGIFKSKQYLLDVNAQKDLDFSLLNPDNFLKINH